MRRLGEKYVYKDAAPTISYVSICNFTTRRRGDINKNATVKLWAKKPTNNKIYYGEAVYIDYLDGLSIESIDSLGNGPSGECSVVSNYIDFFL